MTRRRWPEPAKRLAADDMQHRVHSVYFSAAHAAKDSGIALALAEEAGLRLPVGEAARRQYVRLVELGKGELDQLAVAELTFKDRGGDLPPTSG